MRNNSNPYLNKQNILERMYSLAAGFMGVNPTELSDTAVSLFLESLSAEICRIAGQIEDMESRILDKLAAMIVFDINTIATPAHALLHASSIDSRLQVTTQTDFSYLKGKEKLSFYPICNTRIYKGDVRCFINQGLFYNIDRLQIKTLQTRSGYAESFARNSFWIGLELDSSINNISDMSFYIDFDNVYNKEALLNLLPYTVWKIQDRTIPMRKGIFCMEEVYENDTLELFSGYDYSNKINENIKETYQSHYLTVKGSFDIGESREVFPTKLHNAFQSNFIENFTRPLVWIEVSCPETFTNEIIGSIQVNINTFPVANKELVSKTVDATRLMPIIPLSTGSNESFISVCSLMDSKAREYYEVPVTGKDALHYGTYSIRRGGCERYSKGEAQEYLVNTIDSLKVKTSTFFGRKSASKTDLKKLETDVNLIIKDLGESLSKINERYEIKNYILLEADMADKELFFVEYWLTRGRNANNIKAGSVLVSTSEIPINPTTIRLMSNSKGGKPAPQRPQRYNLYKESMTRNRLLVTHEDIECFCKDNFIDSICEVSIRKGLIENPDPKIGFLHTTDVYLKPHPQLEAYLGEHDKNTFEKVLRENSSATFRYRVFINKTLPN